MNSEQWIAFNVEPSQIDGCCRALNRHKLQFSITPPIANEGYAIHMAGDSAGRVIDILTTALGPKGQRRA